MRINTGHLFSTDNQKTIKYETIIRSHLETSNTKVKEYPKPIYTRVIFLPRISEICYSNVLLHEHPDCHTIFSIHWPNAYTLHTIIHKPKTTTIFKVPYQHLP